MKKFDNGLGIISTVTDDKLTVEISIEGLANGFDRSPNNYCEMNVKPDKKNEFAELVAERVIDECNCETGDSPAVLMFERVFEEIFEGNELIDEIIYDPEEDAGDAE